MTIAAEHPGVALRRWMADRNLDPDAVAVRLGWSRQLFTDRLEGRAPFTAEAALDLGWVLGTTPEYWLRLQNLYDIGGTSAV